MTPCPAPYDSHECIDFAVAVRDVTMGLGGDGFSLCQGSGCAVDPENLAFSVFQYIHTDSGYTSNDTNVQRVKVMEEDVVLLVN